MIKDDSTRLRQLGHPRIRCCAFTVILLGLAIFVGLLFVVYSFWMCWDATQVYDKAYYQLEQEDYRVSLPGHGLACSPKNSSLPRFVVMDCERLRRQSNSTGVIRQRAINMTIQWLANSNYTSIERQFAYDVIMWIEVITFIIENEHILLFVLSVVLLLSFTISFFYVFYYYLWGALQRKIDNHSYEPGYKKSHKFVQWDLAQAMQLNTDDDDFAAAEEAKILEEEGLVIRDSLQPGTSSIRHRLPQNSSFEGGSSLRAPRMPSTGRLQH